MYMIHEFCHSDQIMSSSLPLSQVSSCCRLSLEADLWNRRWGLLGIWGGLIRKWLGEILPPDAHEKSRSEQL